MAERERRLQRRRPVGRRQALGINHPVGRRDWQSGRRGRERQGQLPGRRAVAEQHGGPSSSCLLPAEEEAGDSLDLLSPGREHRARRLEQDDGRLHGGHLWDHHVHIAIQVQARTVLRLRGCGARHEYDQVRVHNGVHDLDASASRPGSDALVGRDDIGRRDVAGTPDRVGAPRAPSVDRVVGHGGAPGDGQLLELGRAEGEHTVVLQQHDAVGGGALRQLQVIRRPLV
mmetsp:Transcript_125518/g.360854  ORF Transcript_125518/g.360854 Transcript_125518/m.360854 type:complete len:229 (+) Transcript_125518:512-1198(+)